MDHEGFGMPLSFFRDENPELESLRRVLQPCRRFFADTDTDNGIELRAANNRRFDTDTIRTKEP